MIITIQKYDPTVDEAPYMEDYEVPLVEYMTLLQALIYIDENIEPLAFDYSCRGRLCGRCAMMFNGEGCTACTMPLTEGNHTVEPLAGLPIIRDLVVDKTSMQDRLSSIDARIRATPITWEKVEEPINYDDYPVLDGFGRCAHCLSCTSTCPAVAVSPDSYIGPAGMVAVAKRWKDPYDEGDRVAQAVELGLWNCTLCGTCDKVCPVAEIEHLEMWEKLRAEAEQRGLTEKRASAISFGKK